MLGFRILTSPLLKIPLLLRGTWLISKAMSPPIPPPQPNDTKASGDPIAVFAKASGYSWRVKLQLVRRDCPYLSAATTNYE